MSLRIGVLGASRIAGLAIVGPAQELGHRLVAVAARDPRRAELFAEKHGVERVLASYHDVINDPDVDAVYNPLANALHAPWNLAAVAAGKPVLTEKPFARDRAEAQRVAAAADAAGITVMEGFHYLFHPATRRALELAGDGTLGELVHVEARMAMPAPNDDDPRWSLELAGGALMDLGCYGLHAHRALGRWAGGEPQLVDARAKERAGAPGVDEWLEADLRFPSGATGAVRCSMAEPRFEMTLRVVGSRGEATVMDFVQPHKDDRVVVRTEAGETTEHLGTRSSYIYQLEAFIQALRGGTPMPTGPDDAVATAQLIDQCYRAAGLPLRARTAPIV